MSGPLRWVVLFFTRPLHFSDIKAIARKLKPRKKETVAVPTPKRAAEHPDSLPAQARARAKAASGPIRAAPTTIRDKLDVAVSEEAADTLPAALRDELFGDDKATKEAARARAADERNGGSAD